jgi:hypothetical protein
MRRRLYRETWENVTSSKKLGAFSRDNPLSNEDFEMLIIAEKREHGRSEKHSIDGEITSAHKILPSAVRS